MTSTAWDQLDVVQHVQQVYLEGSECKPHLRNFIFLVSNIYISPCFIEQKISKRLCTSWKRHHSSTFLTFLIDHNHRRSIFELININNSKYFYNNILGHIFRQLLKDEGAKSLISFWIKAFMSDIEGKQTCLSTKCLWGLSVVGVEMGVNRLSHCLI